MKTNLKNRTQKGFTIIEVLIVLAIAGLILLIVFLAVPALQRNSRNTQRRTDVARFSGAVSEWASNNNGSLPAVAADLTTAGTGVNALANMGFLTAPTVVTAAAATVSNTATVTTFLYVPGTICNGTDATDATSTGASTRQFTLLYATESSTGAAVPQCLAS